MTTVFYRTERNGNLKRRVEEAGTQKELRAEFSNNGMIVVAIYKGDVSYDQHDNKEFNI